MKKFYFIALISMGSFLSAQIDISFEQGESYSLGNLHGQNGWEVTESSDGIVQHQTVSSEQASDGDYSFKNGYEPDYDFQWFPIFGAALTFENPIASDQAISFSYDVMVTGRNGADFEFTMFGINDDQEFAPIAGVGIENRGFIYLIKDDNYDFNYAEATWEAGEWNQIKVEVNASEIKYYVNEVLQSTLPKFNDIDVHGINFLHNNYGQDAYYDNLIFNIGNLSTTDMNVTSDLNVYPNPVLDVAKIKIPNNTIKTIQVFDSTGRLVIQNKGLEEINLSNLPSGSYFLQVVTENGKKYNKKVIKK